MKPEAREGVLKATKFSGIPKVGSGREMALTAILCNFDFYRNDQDLTTFSLIQ